MSGHSFTGTFPVFSLFPYFHHWCKYQYNKATCWMTNNSEHHRALKLAHVNGCYHDRDSCMHLPAGPCFLQRKG